MDFDAIVRGYIQLRDKKEQIKAEYDAKVAKINEVMAKAEGVLIKHFNESGLESVRTEAGTAYKSTKTSATVADWDSFFAHVLANEDYQLLEHRASKKAVEEYRQTNDDLPPGINWREEVTISIRRG